jgi:hypothetical protein
VDLLFHNGSARDASNALIASADVIALVLPIMQRCTSGERCTSGDDIGLALPTNLLVMDGLRPGGGERDL